MNFLNKSKVWSVVGVVLAVATLAWAGTVYIHTWTGSGSRRNTVEFAIAASAPGSAAAFLPGTTNTNALGSSSLRFSNVYTTLLNVSGATTQTGALTVTGVLSADGGAKIPVVDITVATPTAAQVGALFRTSANVVYIATAATSVSDWIKVGGQ